MIPGGLDEEEVRRLKREAAIRQKEEEFKKRRQNEEEKKRQELERMKVDFEAAEQRKREEKMGALQKQARIRAERKENNERLDMKRDKHIRQREDVWRKDTLESIQELVREKEEWDDKVEQRLDDARQRKHNKEQGAREAKNEEALIQEDLDEKREDAIEAKMTKWRIREALRTDQIKEEAQAELLSFIQTPAPLPLKQVLCGRTRPVPTVTELLAAYKDAKEEFDDLKGQDFEMRAVLRNQSLFQYVHDIQKAADENRVKPPEPAVTDLMKKSTRSPRSPKNNSTKGGKGASSSPMRTTGRFANRK
eukprot:TRINITY_DN5432_c0_g1_i1.p1 TRINITY_DN5432_c0_g1~~TRINITY_DN5432_c0_g1_i1.p1  ORF type:complete len:307 (-),score=126.33 TRINITY_DN5432_c0_g1_i1:151-1071(-)